MEGFQSLFPKKAPAPKKKKYRGPSEASKLTDYVIKDIKSKGGTARRVNTQGQWDEENQKWRTSGMKRGFEDIDACLPLFVGEFKLGVKVAIEIKIGKDKQFDLQEKRQKELEAAGGIYLIVKTQQDWESAYPELMSKLRSFVRSQL